MPPRHALACMCETCTAVKQEIKEEQRKAILAEAAKPYRTNLQEEEEEDTSTDEETTEDSSAVHTTLCKHTNTVQSDSGVREDDRTENPKVREETKVNGSKKKSEDSVEEKLRKKKRSKMSDGSVDGSVEGGTSKKKSKFDSMSTRERILYKGEMARYAAKMGF